MNRKQAQELLPLFLALAKGKTIQRLGNDLAWHDVEEINFVSVDSDFYRTKPEPTIAYLVFFDSASGNGARVWCTYGTHEEAEEAIALFNRPNARIVEVRDE